MPGNGLSPRGETPESHFAPSQNPDVHFSIDKDRRLVVVKFEGSVTVQEIAQYVESLVAHPDFDSSFSEITDLRGVEHFRSAGQRLPDSRRSNRSVFLD